MERSPPFTTRPELRGTVGMVASTHWLASAAGMAVLERGGNAFDAAVAAGFVLQVVEPHLNGPGGEAPIVLYSADRDEVLVVEGQGPAPAAATIGRFRELGLDLVPGTGLLAACVPGAFDAWLLLLRELGTLSLAQVLEPALGYAEGGYPVVPGICRSIAAVEELFRTEWPESGRLYLPIPEPGSLFRNRDLAATYRRVLDEAGAGGRERQIDAARDVFYRGFVAEAIAEYLAHGEAMDSSGRRHKGLLSGDDLASWQASLEPPVELDYHGWRVSKTGPWGQGPVFLQQLALLDGYDLGSLDRASAEFVHTVVECAKLAFADREAWYGDPDFVDVPLGELLGTRYAEERRALVGESASAELRPGSPNGREPRLPTVPDVDVLGPGLGEPTRGDTCHVDVVDRHGNAVSA
ncbi:MAG: gamma-glutamyltransferase family protein, partial [Gaiellaceae bacterium]